MGEMINLNDITNVTLWSDSETAYKIKSYDLLGDKKLTVRAVLERVKPFPHLIDDEWSFPATIDDDDIMVDLDFYTQHQPAEDEE